MTPSKGQRVRITPIDSMPNLPREIVVDEVTSEGLIYGITETCDGFDYPFWAIKKIEID